MPEMSDNELDRLFQEAADGIKPEFDPADWRRLEQRLDYEDRGAPVRVVSLWSVGGLLLLFLAWSGFHETISIQEQGTFHTANLPAIKKQGRDTNVALQKEVNEVAQEAFESEPLNDNGKQGSLQEATDESTQHRKNQVNIDTSAVEKRSNIDQMGLSRAKMLAANNPAGDTPQQHNVTGQKNDKRHPSTPANSNSKRKALRTSGKTVIGSDNHTTDQEALVSDEGAVDINERAEKASLKTEPFNGTRHAEHTEAATSGTVNTKPANVDSGNDQGTQIHEKAVIHSNEHSKKAGLETNDQHVTENAKRIAPEASVAANTHQEGNHADRQPHANDTAVAVTHERTKKVVEETSGQHVAGRAESIQPETARLLDRHGKDSVPAQDDSIFKKGSLNSNHHGAVVVPIESVSSAKPALIRKHATDDLTQVEISKKSDFRLTPADTTVEKYKEEPAPEKQHDRVSKTWSLKLPISPDFTSIDYGRTDKSGVNIGLLLEYQPFRHVAVSTGAIWSRKIYTTDDPGTSYSVYGKAYKVNSLDGDCRVLDIPLNVIYYIRPTSRTNFFVSAGLSSYIMLKEKYDFDVTYQSKEYWYQENYARKNNEWFKVLNFSLGIQHQLNDRFFMQAEPFIKSPLSGVGQGKVNLVSMGAFITLKYKFIK